MAMLLWRSTACVQAGSAKTSQSESSEPSHIDYTFASQGEKLLTEKSSQFLVPRKITGGVVGLYVSPSRIERVL